MSLTTTLWTTFGEPTPSGIGYHHSSVVHGVLDARLEPGAAEDQRTGIGRADLPDLRARGDTAGRPLDARVLPAVLLDQGLDPARRARHRRETDLDVQAFVGRGIPPPLLEVHGGHGQDTSCSTFSSPAACSSARRRRL